MSSFSSFRTRSSPFIAQSFSIHRFQIRHSSTSPSASSHLNSGDPVRTGFGRTALSTALAGSGVLGLLLYGFYSFSPTANFESIASLVDRSTSNSEDQKPPRRTFFPKFSLPESSGLLLGGKFLSLPRIFLLISFLKLIGDFGFCY